MCLTLLAVLVQLHSVEVWHKPKPSCLICHNLDRSTVTLPLKWQMTVTAYSGDGFRRATLKLQRCLLLRFLPTTPPSLPWKEADQDPRWNSSPHFQRHGGPQRTGWTGKARGIVVEDRGGVLGQPGSFGAGPWPFQCNGVTYSRHWRGPSRVPTAAAVP